MRFIRTFVSLTSAVLACACGSNPVAPPPPVDDPPKITCPAPVSVTSPTPTNVSYGTATVALGKQPVTTVCTPASGSLFQLGQTDVTCTATDALQRTDSCKFAVTVTAPPHIRLTRFVAFGDSMTWGEDGQNTSMYSLIDLIRPQVQVPAASQYPNVVLSLLSARYTAQTFIVANAGCRGELAANVVSPCAPTTRTRFDSVIAGGSYQAVLLMEGANDLSEQFTTGNSSYADAAIAGLQAMIQDARNAGLPVFLATLPPENPLAATPARRGQAAALVPTFNGRIQSLALAATGIPAVDVYQAFNGDVTTLIGPDGLHPTVAGYSTIANAFFNALKQSLETPSATPTMMFSAPLSPPARTSSSARPPAAGPGSRPATRKPR